MESEENLHCRKKEYQKLSYALKLIIVEKVCNGQISVNHAAKIYNVSRSAVDYWIKKMASFEQQSKAMAKKDEIKKLKERIEELEFVKDFQQDIIAEMEIITGSDIAKKSLPKTLSKEIEKKKRDLLR